MFNPHVYSVPGPRESLAQPIQQTPQVAQRPREAKTSVVAPISREIDLNEIAGFEVPVPNEVYTRDYFLCHATDAAIQRVILSASERANQVKAMSLQLIAKQGQNVTELVGKRHYSMAPFDQETIEDTFPSFTGALYLRVDAVAQVTLLFVTLEILTSKVT
jgi:hypothetical protein